MAVNVSEESWQQYGGNQLAIREKEKRELPEMRRRKRRREAKPAYRRRKAESQSAAKAENISLQLNRRKSISKYLKKSNYRRRSESEEKFRYSIGQKRRKPGESNERLILARRSAA